MYSTLIKMSRSSAIINPSIIRRCNNLRSSLINVNEKEEWFFTNNDITHIGITKKAVDLMGELVYSEFLFDKGDEFKKGEELLVLESVKASETIDAPFDGVIFQNNDCIADDIEIINNNPDKTWLIQIKALHCSKK